MHKGSYTVVTRKTQIIHYNGSQLCCLQRIDIDYLVSQKMIFTILEIDLFWIFFSISFHRRLFCKKYIANDSVFARKFVEKHRRIICEEKRDKNYASGFPISILSHQLRWYHWRCEYLSIPQPRIKTARIWNQLCINQRRCICFGWSVYSCKNGKDKKWYINNQNG